MLTSEPQWVALYTNPRAEKRAEKNLGEKGYEVYLPLLKELHTWSDRKKWVDVPMLKSYIFARITKFQQVEVLSVSGVSHIVKFNGSVAIIPESDIEMMRDFIAAKMDIHIRTVEQLRRGSRVRICSGGLAGKEGMLVSDSEDGNFAVEITGISMAMVVHVEQEMLELIEENEEQDAAPKTKKYTIR